jgi:hypothetical protein
MASVVPDTAPYRIKLGAAVRDPDVSPLTMLFIWCDLNFEPGDPDPVLEDFNPLDWSPETIKLELEDHLGGEIPDEAVDRLLAAIRCTSDSAFQSPHDFREIGNLVNCVPLQVIPDSGGAILYDRLEADEMAWMVWVQLFLLSADEDAQEEPPDPRTFYSERVRAYMGQILIDEGLGGEEPYPLEGLPIFNRLKSAAGPLDELASSIEQMRDEKVGEIEDYVRANIELFQQQVMNLPFWSTCCRRRAR